MERSKIRPESSKRERVRELERRVRGPFSELVSELPCAPGNILLQSEQ